MSGMDVSDCMLNISPKLDAYTSVLSNRCFCGVLWCLFSGGVSFLDAFRTYPVSRSCPAYLIR